MTDVERLSIQVGVWAEGKPVVHHARHILTGSPRLDSAGWFDHLRLPSIEHPGLWDLRLDVQGRGSAGPEDWLALSLTLYSIDGSVLGSPNIPAVLYRRAWPVPSVTHLPARYDLPVYTVTLDVPDQNPDDDPMLTWNPGD